MVPVPYSANDIGTEDFFPFLELGPKFIEFHSVWIFLNLIPGSGSPSVGGSNKEMVANNIFGNKGVL